MANWVARYCVVPAWRQGGQSQFVDRPVPTYPDTSTALAREWALERLQEPLDLAAMAGQVRMSVRTFTRRFRAETGMSPGQWLTQQRVGRGGRPFTLYKLRTMRADAAPYAVAPRAGDDPRVTRYGRWLRRSSIDELPQLWNVLRGDMSLVGPRPEMPFIAERYDDWQRRRLSVSPGITGLWQILGRKDLPMHENLQYDFYYIRNRSLVLDLSILLRTVGAVLSRRGAF